MGFKSGPGRSDRNGISFVEVVAMFSDNEKARLWFENAIWQGKPKCPHCKSANVQCEVSHKTMTHRCRDCENRPMFSVRTGTIMHKSKLDYVTWGIAIYLLTTNIKGISSMRLHRELSVTQKTAWHLAHRLRETYDVGDYLFEGPVESDECYMGGKEGNKKASKKLRQGRGGVGKTIVVGIKDRRTNKIVAAVVPNTKKSTIQEFVEGNTAVGAVVYTDEAKCYEGIDRTHEAVCHSVGEYVRGMAHTNGVESFWNLLKKGFGGVYHKMSPKHMHRYLKEFAGRHNDRDLDTIDQMENIVRGMVGKSLTYEALIA